MAAAPDSWQLFDDVPARRAVGENDIEQPIIKPGMRREHHSAARIPAVGDHQQVAVNLQLTFLSELYAHAMVAIAVERPERRQRVLGLTLKQARAPATPAIHPH